MKSKFLKYNLYLLIITLIFTVILASCDNSDNIGTLSIDISSLTGSEYDEKTDAPVIVEARTVDDGRVIFSGTCEEGATIYVLYENKVIHTTKSHYGSFILELSVARKNSPMEVSLCAKSDRKALSDPTTDQAYFRTPDKGISDWVWVGKDFHLFFSNTSDNYYRKDVLNTEEENLAKKRISERVNWLDENLGATPIYILVPNPNEIYSEYMPEKLGQIPDTQSLHDQSAALLAAAGAKVIDMKPILEQHKNDEFFIYHNTDSHWTEYAAYFAYDELFDYISQSFPASSPRPIEDFGFANESHQVGDLYFDLGMDVSKLYETSTYSNLTFETPVNILKYKSGDSTIIAEEPTKEHTFVNSEQEEKPNIIIMRDSYSIMMFDFIAERCATTTMLAMWDFTFDKERFTNLDVDYVIYIVSDMNLKSLYK
ncbi:MAG: hypothetical protein A2Y15_00270 [Clostridiales bacterium GWF2_36_10]|nr:MAG: hypothetical protein A2Y15_00270 [Clostridiales bacterium GWF2_36_10]HAN21775.1 hypothetical protein [Clostridiales bacterium]